MSEGGYQAVLSNRSVVPEKDIELSVRSKTLRTAKLFHITLDEISLKCNCVSYLLSHRFQMYCPPAEIPVKDFLSLEDRSA